MFFAVWLWTLYSTSRQNPERSEVMCIFAIACFWAGFLQSIIALIILRAMVRDMDAEDYLYIFDRLVSRYRTVDERHEMCKVIARSLSHYKV